MRLAGTWNRYSSSATPQLTSAAMIQGLLFSSLRWAYQAKVMNTLLHSNRQIDTSIGCMEGPAEKSESVFGARLVVQAMDALDATALGPVVDPAHHDVVEARQHEAARFDGNAEGIVEPKTGLQQRQ